MKTEKSVYDYLEYREFLKDQYAYLKSVDKKYSQRFFMNRLGVKSTGFFAEILNGKRNLNHQNILSFAKILKLDRDEAGYFENLVYFNQARSIKDKDHWLLKMMECSKVNSKILNRDVYEYFSKWYFAAIRELLFFDTKAVNPQEIADKLCPSITREEAQQALMLLEKLAMIERTANGYYRQKDAIVSTGDLVHSVEIANYQLQTIELAKQAIDAVSVNQREISTLTMSISGDAFEKIVAIIKKTKQDVIKTVQHDSNEDRVYQLNMQFFPLTKVNS